MAIAAFVNAVAPVTQNPEVNTIQIGGTEIGFDEILGLLSTLLIKNYDVSESKDSFGFEFDAAAIYNNLAGILGLAGYRPLLDRALGAVLGVDPAEVGGYIEAHNVTGRVGIAFDADGKASFTLDADVKTVGGIALTGDVLAVDNAVYSGEEADALLAQFPAGYDDPDVPSFNPLNIDARGTLSLNSADGTIARYNWELVADIDPLELIANAVSTQGTLDAYSWFDNARSSSLHFSLWHVHDASCGAFCRDKYTSGTDMINEMLTPEMYAQFPQLEGMGYGKSSNVLDILWAPAALGRPDVLVDVNPLALLGPSLLDKVFAMLGTDKAQINQTIGPLLGSVDIDTLLAITLPSNWLIPLNVETIARYIDRSDLTPPAPEAPATALATADIGGILETVVSLLETLREAVVLGDNALTVRLDPLYEAIFGLLGDALAGSGITADQIGDVIDVVTGGASELELSLTEANYASAYTRSYDYAEALTYNPGMSSKRVFGYTSYISQILGEQVAFADRIVSMTPETGDDGLSLLYNEEGRLLDTAHVAAEELATFLRGAYVKYTYTDASDNVGTLLVPVIGAQGVDMASTELQTFKVFTLIQDGSLLNTVSALWSIIGGFGIDLPLPGQTAEVSLKLAELASVTAIGVPTEPVSVNVGEKLPTKLEYKLVYADGVEKTVATEYASFAGDLIAEENSLLSKTLTAAKANASGSVSFVYAGVTATIEYVTAGEFALNEDGTLKGSYTPKNPPAGQETQLVILRSKLDDVRSVLGNARIYYAAAPNSSVAVDMAEVEIIVDDPSFVRDGLLIKEGVVELTLRWKDYVWHDRVTVAADGVETSGWYLDLTANADGTITATVDATDIGNADRMITANIEYRYGSQVCKPLNGGRDMIQIDALSPKQSWTFSDLFVVYPYSESTINVKLVFQDGTDRVITQSIYLNETPAAQKELTQFVTTEPVSQLSGSTHRIGVRPVYSPAYSENDPDRGAYYVIRQVDGFTNLEASSLYVTDEAGERVVGGFTPTLRPASLYRFSTNPVYPIELRVNSLAPGRYTLHASFRDVGSTKTIASYEYDFEVTALYEYMPSGVNHGFYKSLANSTGYGSTLRTLTIEKLRLLKNFDPLTGMGTEITDFTAKFAAAYSKPAAGAATYTAFDPAAGIVISSMTNFWWEIYAASAVEDATLLMTVNGKTYIQPVTVNPRSVTVTMPYNGNMQLATISDKGSQDVVARKQLTTFAAYEFQINFLADICVDNRYLTVYADGVRLTPTAQTRDVWTFKLASVAADTRIDVYNLRYVTGIALSDKPLPEFYVGDARTLAGLWSALEFDVTYSVLGNTDPEAPAEAGTFAETYTQPPANRPAYYLLYDRIVWNADAFIAAADGFGDYDVIVSAMPETGNMNNLLTTPITVTLSVKSFDSFETAMTEYGKPVSGNFYTVLGADGVPELHVGYGYDMTLQNFNAAWNNRIRFTATKPDGTTLTLPFRSSAAASKLEFVNLPAFPFDSTVAATHTVQVRVKDALYGDNNPTAKDVRIVIDGFIAENVIEVRQGSTNSNDDAKFGYSLEKLATLPVSVTFADNEQRTISGDFVEAVTDGATPYDPELMGTEQTVNYKFKGVETTYPVTFTLYLDSKTQIKVAKIAANSDHVTAVGYGNRDYAEAHRPVVLFALSADATRWFTADELNRAGVNWTAESSVVSADGYTYTATGIPYVAQSTRLPAITYTWTENWSDAGVASTSNVQAAADKNLNTIGYAGVAWSIDPAKGNSNLTTEYTNYFYQELGRFVQEALKLYDKRLYPDGVPADETLWHSPYGFNSMADFDRWYALDVSAVKPDQVGIYEAFLTIKPLNYKVTFNVTIKPLSEITGNVSTFNSRSINNFARGQKPTAEQILAAIGESNRYVIVKDAHRYYRLPLTAEMIDVDPGNEFDVNTTSFGQQCKFALKGMPNVTDTGKKLQVYVYYAS